MHWCCAEEKKIGPIRILVHSLAQVIRERINLPSLETARCPACSGLTKSILNSPSFRCSGSSHIVKDE